jgi:hypothetical protein
MLERSSALTFVDSTKQTRTPAGRLWDVNSAHVGFYLGTGPAARRLGTFVQ